MYVTEQDQRESRRHPKQRATANHPSLLPPCYHQPLLSDTTAPHYCPLPLSTTTVLLPTTFLCYHLATANHLSLPPLCYCQLSLSATTVLLPTTPLCYHRATANNPSLLPLYYYQPPLSVTANTNLTLFALSHCSYLRQNASLNHHQNLVTFFGMAI